MVGYPSMDPLIHGIFSRVMSRVEGGDLLVMRRGQENTVRSIVPRLLIRLPTDTFRLELVNIAREDGKTATPSRLQSNSQPAAKQRST